MFDAIVSDAENDAELILGTELFHSQIELNHRRSSLRKVSLPFIPPSTIGYFPTPFIAVPGTSVCFCFDDDISVSSLSLRFLVGKAFTIVTLPEWFSFST